MRTDPVDLGDEHVSVTIKSVTVDLLKVPVDNPYVAVGKPITSYWHVMARVRTADGIEGVGYVVLLNDELVRPLADATRELGQLIVGLDVFRPEVAWAKLNKAGDWSGPGGFLNYAIAPLDIAMWDAAGKAAGQSVSRLLGGFKDRSPAYASDGLWYSLSLDQLAASASRHRQDGFSALKLRIGNETAPEGEVRRVAAVREAVGDDMDIMVDATELWDLNRALRTGRALQQAGISWLEDPVNHRNVAALARMTEVLDVPIATGEHLYSLAEFRSLLTARATNVAILDLARVGGITQWRHIASLAHGLDIQVCGHVIPEVHVHLLSAVPNGHLVEYVPRSAPILQQMPNLQDGHLVVPDAPGLGLVLDEPAIGRFKVTG